MNPKKMISSFRNKLLLTTTPRPRAWLFAGTALLILLVVAFIGFKMVITARVKSRIDQEIARVSVFLQIKYDHVDVNPFNKKITVSGIEITPTDTYTPPINIQKIQVRFDRGEGETLSMLKLDVFGLQSDLNLTTNNIQVIQIIQQLGLEKLDSNFHILYRYNASNLSALLSIEQEIEGACRLGFAVSVGNFNPNLVGIIQNTNSITLSSIRFSYIDESLIPRLLDFQAQDEGLTREELVKKIQAQLDEVLAENHDPQLANLYRAIQDFLNNPKSLVLEGIPVEPIRLGDLQGRSRGVIAEQLNIQVKVN